MTELDIDVHANPPMDLGKLSKEKKQEIFKTLQELYIGRVISLPGDPDCGGRTLPEQGLSTLSRILTDEATANPSGIAQDSLMELMKGMSSAKGSEGISLGIDFIGYAKTAYEVFALFTLEDRLNEERLIVFPYVESRQQGKTDQIAWSELITKFNGYGFGVNQIAPDSSVIWAVNNLKDPKKAKALYTEVQLKYAAVLFAENYQGSKDAAKSQILQELKVTQIPSPTPASNQNTDFWGSLWGTITGVVQSVGNSGQSVIQKAQQTGQNIFINIWDFIKAHAITASGQSNNNLLADIGTAFQSTPNPTPSPAPMPTPTPTPQPTPSPTPTPTIPQQNNQTEQQNNSVLCNGQYWANKCSASQTFYCSPSGGGECQANSKPNINISELEQQIHALINNERQKQGLAALSYDGRLADIARGHSQDMATRNYAAHISPDGCDPACRYKQNNYKFSMLAENISGRTTYKTRYPDGVVDEYNTQAELASWIVQGWMNSSGHRANILTPDLKNEGIGVVIKDDGGVLTTEDFAVPSGQQTNLIQCNGISYNPCQSGQVSYCPPSGTMVCHDPNAGFCNGQYWSPCPAGKTFSCSSDGAVCQTPPSVCVPSWSCTGFANSACINGQQTQTCTDTNGCGVNTNKPSLTQSCYVAPTPTPPAPTIPKPVITLTTDSGSVVYGQGTTIRWSSSNATACTASAGWSGNKALFGSEDTGPLNYTQTYVLTCTGEGGSTTQYVAVNVFPPPNPVPAAPTNLVATALSSSRVMVNWQDNANNELGFKIEKKVQGETFAQITTVNASPGSGLGSGFTVSYEDSNLSSGTNYCYRVRAYNSGGDSSYSNEACATTGQVVTQQPTNGFACGSSVNDIDGNSYGSIQIGNQCWLKQNLKVTKNSSSNPITRYCYNNDATICDTDGGLYDWNTAMNGATTEGAQGICPNGWHIPKH